MTATCPGKNLLRSALVQKDRVSAFCTGWPSIPLPTGQHILICMQWWHSDSRETITEIVLFWVVETSFGGRVQRDLTVDTSTKRFDVFFQIIGQLYYLSLWGVLFLSAQTSFTCCSQMQFEIAFVCRPGFRSCSRQVSASLLVSVSILIGCVAQPNPSSYQICGFRSDLSCFSCFVLIGHDPKKWNGFWSFSLLMLFINFMSTSFICDVCLGVWIRVFHVLVQCVCLWRRPSPTPAWLFLTITMSGPLCLKMNLKGADTTLFVENVRLRSKVKSCFMFFNFSLTTL